MQGIRLKFLAEAEEQSARERREHGSKKGWPGNRFEGLLLIAGRGCGTMTLSGENGRMLPGVGLPADHDKTRCFSACIWEQAEVLENEIGPISMVS